MSARSAGPTPLTAVVTWLRRDWLSIALYAAATVVMTYPVAAHLNDGWLAYRDIDTYVKLWDQWWLGRTIAAGGPLNFTSDLFHPIGLDLTYHSISWTVTALMVGLEPLLGSYGAYNVTLLVSTFTTAYGAYLFCRTLTDHRAAAWLGGAVYSFIPYHIAHTGGHPDLTHLAGIPLVMLFFGRALSRSSWKDALIGAVLVATIAFTGLYLLEFTIMTLLPVFAYTALRERRWRAAGFWRALLVFGAASAVLTAPRTLPLIQSAAALSSAIEEKFDAEATQTDLLALITPSHFNPIFQPVVGEIADRFVMNRKWPGYIGLLPLTLIAVALTHRRRRLETWAWLLLGAFFLVMALGPNLRVNGELYRDVSLPYAWLSGFPPVRVVGRPDYFIIGWQLPLAVLAALGADRVLGAVKLPGVRTAVAISAGLFLLFEYWNGPYPGIQPEIDPVYAQLAQEAGDFAVIELPMGRRPSKDYVFYQTTHTRPMVEGLSGRTLPEAYRYIDANPVLAAWRGSTPLDCATLSAETFETALDQLSADGFRYVIVHHQDGQVPEAFSGYLTGAPVYTDAQLSLYAVSALRDRPPCR